MQKILRSPASMKKKAANKIFGVPLRELGRDASGVKVPDLIKKVSDFIQMHGIGHEGIFRVNGSSRVVDNLRSQYDRTGDADLEEAEDVMAVASLLKLFLRELPDPVMTEHLHHTFISIQEEYRSDRSECVKHLKQLIQQLPEENYMLLQYIISFLVKVSKYEDTNKMSSQALAIVFGPNLFRCSEGLQGLREQGITNTIVRNLIEDYDRLFKDKDMMETEETEQPRRGSSGSSKRIQVKAAMSEMSPPLIKRREGIRKRVVEEDVKDYNSNSYSDTDREEQRKEKEPEDKSTSDHSNHSSLSAGLLSPRDLLSGEERSYSPFNLDSDNGTSAAPSPVINDITSELVEQTIKQSVTQHLFGREDSTESPIDDTPIPSPRRRRQEKKKQRALQEASKLAQDNNKNTTNNSAHQSQTTDGFPSTVQDRIRSFSDSGQPPGGSPAANNSSSSPEYSPSTKMKLQSSSRAFELFESQGIVIAPKESQSKSSISSSILDGSQSSESLVKPRRKAPEAPARPFKTGRPKSPSTGSPNAGTPSNGSPRGGSPRSGSPRSKSPRSKSPKHSNMRLLEEKRSVSPSEDAATAEDVPIDGHTEDLGSVTRNSPALKSLTSGRAPPPKNRRSPSRKSRKKKESDSPEMVVDIEPILIAQEVPMEESSPPPPPDVLPTDVQNTKEREQPQAKPRKKKSKSKYQANNQGTTKMGRDDVMNGQNLDVDFHQTPAKSPRRWRSVDEKHHHNHHHRALDEHIHHHQHLRTEEKERRHHHSSGEEKQQPTSGENRLADPDLNKDSPHQRDQEGHHCEDHQGNKQGQQGSNESNVRQRQIPPLDLASLLEHTADAEPIPAWQTINTHLDPTPDEAVLSPRSGLKIQAVVNISNNTEIPPSPPSAQSYMKTFCPSKRAEKHGEEDVSTTKHLTRQIRSLKRKIRQFEDEFEKEKGYKPSHLEKSSQPEIKKMMGELKRANKQLKEAKEDAAKAKVPLHSTLPAAKVKRNLLDDLGGEATHLDVMRDALEQAQIRIEEKRMEGHRPHDLNQMDRQQVQEEKTAIQKALLHLENRFGRPSTKETKELMKPLYDRYRNLKKLIAKFEIRHATEDNFNQVLDLQTIEEHEETKEFKPKQLMNPLISDPLSQGEVHSKYRDEDEMGTTDFAVTQDLSLMKDSALPLTEYDEGYPSPDGNGRRDSRDSSTSPALDLLASNLHEASVVELIASQNQAKDDKRRLRKVLKEFEDNFFQETGRRVQREDRTPMESEYTEYKQLKAKLRLMDALLSKRLGLV